jgi:lactoylglutathione lyase
MPDTSTCSIGFIKTIPVFVTDVERAKRFWSENFSFEIVSKYTFPPDSTTSAIVIYDVAPPGAQTKLTLLVNPDAFKKKGTAAKAIFQCDDIRSTYTRLKQEGVRVSEPESLPDGHYLSFEDEDDNRFFIKQEL